VQFRQELQGHSLVSGGPVLKRSRLLWPVDSLQERLDACQDNMGKNLVWDTEPSDRTVVTADVLGPFSPYKETNYTVLPVGVYLTSSPDAAEYCVHGLTNWAT